MATELLEREDTGADDRQAPPARPRPVGRQLAIAIATLAVLAGAAFVLLLTLAGGGGTADQDIQLASTDVSDLLLRSVTPTTDSEIEVLYTPTWYFEWSGRELPSTSSNPMLAFFVFENVHVGEVPDTVPSMTLLTDVGAVEPIAFDEISVAAHHRVSQLVFPATTDSGRLLVSNDDSQSLTVAMTMADASRLLFEWDLPLPNGLGVIGASPITAPVTDATLSIGAIIAILGGMLTALSPCLLLLATYYTTVLSGTAAAAVEQGSAQRRLLMTGLLFVAGFTAVYTAGGVIAGFVGESAARFENVDRFARPVSIVAGALVILLGIRMASQARVPLVCKIPVMNRPTRSGWMGSLAMGSTFAVGCLSCFSATVLSALLLYAGATGSPLTGGLVMLMFSSGVGVMFLVAAALVAMAAPVSKWLMKAQPVIGGVSAAAMIFFGILMVTYQFHKVTGYLFRLWS